MELPEPHTTAEKILAFAFERQALLFGNFQTKAGRSSPYFFNAGLFSNGESIGRLAGFYADTIIQSSLQFDGLFGPAYKGIPLVTATAMALSFRGKNYPFSYDRKEEKKHGESGSLIGAPLKGRILVVDDVISAGTSVRNSVKLIHDAKAELAGVVVSLDRQEKGQGELSAIQEVKQMFGAPVVAVATLANLVDYLARAWAQTSDRSINDIITSINAYRKQYGAVGD